MSAETMVNKVAAIEPAWLLVLLLVGLALAVLLPTLRFWLGRHKHSQDPMVAAQIALQEGRYAEAETMFLFLLKKAEEDFGPEDLKVASAARNRV